uniref:Uncharacterized protein n=1 Tax=Physcomitrium patens TaxID=3218 RepID=A0A2K1KCS9_PHYPA|nr:hypothetical protein PHYPA_010774 [Physcomitrium patens]
MVHLLNNYTHQNNYSHTCKLVDSVDAHTVQHSRLHLDCYYRAPHDIAFYANILVVSSCHSTPLPVTNSRRHKLPQYCHQKPIRSII